MSANPTNSVHLIESMPLPHPPSPRALAPAGFVLCAFALLITPGCGSDDVDSTKEDTTDTTTVQPFMLGVDISGVPEQVDQGAVFVDTDGDDKPVLELFANHGVNYVRLRTFVDPQAPYGYDEGDGGACRKSEAYCDLQHTIEFGRTVKDANMGLLLDFHYSDTWADPGKQIIPEAWRDASSIEELAALLRAYTEDAISTLIEGGARPDVVQIGNEITPGMLIHVPTPNTDCWGNNSAVNALNGSTNHWNNLALLLQAGIDGVHEVDPTIKTMVHLENTDDTNGAIAWVAQAKKLEVDFDILGMSCYQAYQGPPSMWMSTFEALADRFPDLSFVVAEYGPDTPDVMDVLAAIPDGRGVGAFRWEPTQSGTWGASMFSQMGEDYHANEEAFADFDDAAQRFDL